MNKFQTMLVVLMCLVGFGCSKQMSAKSASRLDLSNVEMDECKREGLFDEPSCKAFQGGKARTMSGLPPVVAAPPPPSFLPQPGALAQQPGVTSPPVFPLIPGMPSAMTPMRGHGGYAVGRIVPPCVDSRGGAINVDRMLLIDNSRMANFFVTLHPLTAFEPCWPDRVDPVVIPIGGQMVSTFAVPEKGVTNMMSTIPVGCLNGSLGPRHCPKAPRLIVKAWRDLGPGIAPEYNGEWDATEELTGKMGGTIGARLIIAQHVFHR